MYRPEHFDLQEVVCPHVFYRYGIMAWQFRNPIQMKLMDWVRDRFGPVFVNDWYEKYRDTDYIKFIADKMIHRQPLIPKDMPDRPKLMLSERGLRCNICDLYLEKTTKGIIYMSGHGLGDADDYNVQGRTAEEIRQDLIKNQKLIPFPIRLEKAKSWVHMDCEDAGIVKVDLFDA
jgi:hypothetical protein